MGREEIIVLIKKLLVRYHASHPILFGSYARGEEKRILKDVTGSEEPPRALCSVERRKSFKIQGFRRFSVIGAMCLNTVKTGNVEMVEHNIRHEVFQALLWYNHF